MENVDLSIKLKECEMKDEERDTISNQLGEALMQLKQEREKVNTAWQDGFE